MDRATRSWYAALATLALTAGLASAYYLLVVRGETEMVWALRATVGALGSIVGLVIAAWLIARSRVDGGSWPTSRRIVGVMTVLTIGCLVFLVFSM
jgi:zinc transporter ZupT